MPTPHVPSKGPTPQPSFIPSFAPMTETPSVSPTIDLIVVSLRSGSCLDSNQLSVEECEKFAESRHKTLWAGFTDYISRPIGCYEDFTQNGRIYFNNKTSGIDCNLEYVCFCRETVDVKDPVMKLKTSISIWKDHPHPNLI